MPESEYINVDLRAEMAPNSPTIWWSRQEMLILFYASMFS